VTVTAGPDLGTRPLRTLAIVPAVRAPRHDEVAPEAEDTVTEIVTQAASRAERWTLLEPEKVARALAGDSTTKDRLARAGWVAKQLGADVALLTEIEEYRERVGSDYGASEAASVSVTLLLIAAGGHEPVWKAVYSFEQVPLSYNLWNFWGVLRGGPRWLTASELARIGIDEAVSRLGALPSR
jgi:hypothetical protein